jgi:hypothetical protein
LGALIKMVPIPIPSMKRCGAAIAYVKRVVPRTT